MARVMAAGTFDPEFGRNRRLCNLLERAGHEVVECRVDLWPREKYAIASEGKITAVRRAVLAYPRLVWRFLRAPRADAVLVMYPGWFDMLVLGVLARLRRMPVLFDIFVSFSDTIVSDRKIVGERSFAARVCRTVDRLSLHLARRVIADTPLHADFFAQLGHIDRDRIGVVPVGAEDDLFHPLPAI